LGGRDFNGQRCPLVASPVQGRSLEWALPASPPFPFAGGWANASGKVRKLSENLLVFVSFVLVFVVVVVATAGI